MDVLGLIYAFFIGPLELFFEVIYSAAYQVIGDPGLSIVFLSLAMNFLVLPLYRRADAMQEAQREQAARMKPWTDHIKRTFKGDERFMMLQTYNRQCGHKSTDALKGSVSLLLEIPFFIAAYHFLSNLQLLQGVPFGPIPDLGAPDGLLVVGGVSINLLPILMTAINLASAIVYMKGLPLANKIQMYGIAAIFLVLLYNSPAGLVFYWTLNNVFSLLKNIFSRLRDPGLAVSIAVSVTAVVVAVLCITVLPVIEEAKPWIALVAGVLQLPLVWALLKRKCGVRLPALPEASAASGRTFLLCGLFLALFTGALIPLAVLQASPSEFAAVGESSPLWYVARSLALSVGTFVLWFGVFYWLASPRGKTLFCCFMVAFTGVSIVDYLAFVPDLGNLTVDLQYEGIMAPTADAVVFNLLVVVGISAALIVLYLFKEKAAQVAAASLCVAVAAMSVMGAADVAQRIPADPIDEGSPHVVLSKDGRNVVVVMMDRSVGYFLPYLLHEKPELKDKLAGFTYYPNTISYGFITNVGSPGLYGGYDYKPENLNARSSELLVEKQNESLKVLPTIFMENGYEATFFDPTYAGYGWRPDLSVFDDMPDLHTYITMDGTWDTREGLRSSAVNREGARERNFFCYSLFRVVPVALQQGVYHEGDYNSSAALWGGPGFIQVTDGASRSVGTDARFMAPYSALQHLPDMTYFREGEGDVLFMVSNDTAHGPSVLQEPEYIPAMEIDNTAYDEEHARRYADDGSYLQFGEESGAKGWSPTMHYEINMAALRELCNWFDYLRENGVWDNTRIIVVSDHGRNLGHYPDVILKADGDGKREWVDLTGAFCMLMVKDFDAQEFTVDETFMTNADTPALALEGLVDDPVNPFTGNPITVSSEEKADVHVFTSEEWDTDENNGTTFLPGHWFSVHDDIYDAQNWEYLGYY